MLQRFMKMVALPRCQTGRSLQPFHLGRDDLKGFVTIFFQNRINDHFVFFWGKSTGRIDDPSPWLAELYRFS